MSKLAPVVGVCVSVRPSVPCMTNRSPWNACQCQLQLRNNSSPWYTFRLAMTQIRDIGTSGGEWVWKKNYLVEHFPFVSGCLRLPVMAWLGNPITHTRTLACWAVAAFIFFAFISVQVHISFKCQAMFVLGFHSCSYICPNHRQCLLLAFF